jgi:hypothetical protein
LLTDTEDIFHPWASYGNISKKKVMSESLQDEVEVVRAVYCRSGEFAVLHEGEKRKELNLKMLCFMTDVG